MSVARVAGSNFFLYRVPRVALAKPRSTLGYMLAPSFAGLQGPLRRLNDHFHDFERDVDSENDSDGGEYIPGGQLRFTSRAASSCSSHDPVTVTALHAGKTYLNFTLVHKGQWSDTSI